MKLCLYYFQTQKEAWAEAAAETYYQKISRMDSFELIGLKSKSADRDSKEVKLRAEAKVLVDKLSDKDELILFDPKGKKYSSEEFAEFLQKRKESGKQRICFAIGGPYGFSDEIKKAASYLVSLSDLTMNHHVALTMGLEQIYRAQTIAQGLPYHNA